MAGVVKCAARESVHGGLFYCFYGDGCGRWSPAVLRLRLLHDVGQVCSFVLAARRGDAERRTIHPIAFVLSDEQAA